MPVTPTTLKLKYPQFSNYDDTLIQLWLDESTNELELSHFGDRADLATEYWTCARLLELDQAKRGTMGPISSHSKDGVSWSIENKGDGSNMYDEKYKQLVYRSYRGGCVI